jgi:hypothetical protein
MFSSLIKSLPQVIQNQIGEYNCQHRLQMKIIFEEMYWRTKFNHVIEVLPGRLHCIQCHRIKPIICCSVNFCTATCGRYYSEETYYIEDDLENDSEFSSIGFQYPGWGKKAGFTKC